MRPPSETHIYSRREKRDMHVLGFHVPGTRTWEQEQEEHAERRFEEVYTAARELERLVSHDANRNQIAAELGRLEDELKKEGEAISEAVAVVSSLGARAEPTNFHGDRQKERIIWLKQHLVKKGFMERYGREFGQLCTAIYDEQQSMVATIGQGLGKYAHSRDVSALVQTLVNALRRMSTQLFKVFHSLEKESFTEEEFEQRIMEPLRNIRRSANIAHKKALQRVA